MTIEVHVDPRKLLIGPFTYADVSTIADACEELFGYYPRPRTITDAIRRGQLRIKEVGRERFVTAELLEEWMESRTTTADTAQTRLKSSAPQQS